MFLPSTKTLSLASISTEAEQEAAIQSYYMHLLKPSDCYEFYRRVSLIPDCEFKLRILRILERRRQFNWKYPSRDTRDELFYEQWKLKVVFCPKELMPVEKPTKGFSFWEFIRLPFTKSKETNDKNKKEVLVNVCESNESKREEEQESLLAKETNCVEKKIKLNEREKILNEEQKKFDYLASNFLSNLSIFEF